MTIASILTWVKSGDTDDTYETFFLHLFWGNVSYVAPLFFLVCLASVMNLFINKTHDLLLYTLMSSTKSGVSWVLNKSF